MLQVESRFEKEGLESGLGSSATHDGKRRRGDCTLSSLGHMVWYLHERLVTELSRLAADSHAIVQDETAEIMKLQEQKDGC